MQWAARDDDRWDGVEIGAWRVYRDRATPTSTDRQHFSQARSALERDAYCVLIVYQGEINAFVLRSGQMRDICEPAEIRFLYRRPEPVGPLV